MLLSAICYAWGSVCWLLISPILLLSPVQVNPGIAEAVTNARTYLAPLLPYMLVLTSAISFCFTLEMGILSFKGVMFLVGFFHKDSGAG